MIKSFATLTFLLTGLCVAQTGPSTSPQPETMTYRLSFVVSYPGTQQPAQTLTVDLPILPNRAGMAALQTTAGIEGNTQTAVQQVLRCTDVHKSQTGLSAQVMFTSEHVTGLLPGSNEPLINQSNFTRKVDVPLNMPTKITNEMHITYLKPGDEKLGVQPPPAPQITLTASRL